MSGGTETALTKFRRQRIGFVFQQFNLLPTLTVLQNVGQDRGQLGECTASYVGDWCGDHPG
jgi:ABC-type lipoprotein export system ATPase subunit